MLVTGATVGLSVREQPRYQATAEVLLSQQNLAASLTGIQNQAIPQGTDVVAQTQAELAATPTVAERTLKAVGLDRSRTAASLLASSKVSAETNTNLLDFAVTDSSRSLAARLATAYARQYTIYRHQLDTASIVSAARELERRLAELEASGDRHSALYASLVDKDQQLRTFEALQTSNASVVRTADGAVQVQPKTVRNGILAFFLGLVLGLALAFLYEALDTKVRGADTVSHRLGLPLLARVAQPPRSLRNSDRLVTVATPNSVGAEAFRMLRTNLEFVNLERGARSIMVTSAVEGEGKSTTASNLAIAMARAGRHVLLVDLDLRRPYLGKLFNVKGHPGLTDVMLSDAPLESAIVRVPLLAPKSGNPRKNGAVRGGGVLEVVASGPTPPNPGEIIASSALGDVLTALASRADIVLVDSAPLLAVGDALALSAKVDALLLVVRLNVMRRPMLNELKRALDASQVAPLGFVLTQAELEAGYGYGHGYGYAHKSHDGNLFRIRRGDAGEQLSGGRA